MPRQKQQIDTVKKHLTKEEKEERKQCEDKIKELAKDKIRPPTYLNPKAKKIFKIIVKDLEPLGLLANVDVFLLGILSDCIEKYIRVTEKIDKEDLQKKHTNKFGATNEIENPLIKTQLKYAEMIKKYSNEFGLSVAARLKIISVNLNSNDDDGFDDDF